MYIIQETVFNIYISVFNLYKNSLTFLIKKISLSQKKRLVENTLAGDLPTRSQKQERLSKSWRIPVAICHF